MAEVILDLSNQGLTILREEDLPEGLTVLNVQCNLLTSLPPLPTTLKILICGGNQLASLPPLHEGLQYLSCDYNQLTSLPPLPTSLQDLDCRYNQLTSLPHLPAHLRYLFCCTDNPLHVSYGKIKYDPSREDIIRINCQTRLIKLHAFSRAVGDIYRKHCARQIQKVWSEYWLAPTQINGYDYPVSRYMLSKQPVLM